MQQQLGVEFRAESRQASRYAQLDSLKGQLKYLQFYNCKRNW
jgi:hypothetical protein